jgi:hypothetical protein
MEYIYTKSKIILTENGIEQKIKIKQHFKEDENGSEILIKEEFIK